MWLSYISLILITLAYVIYYICTRTFGYWKKRNVKYIEPVPLFGNFKDSLLRRKNIAVMFQDFYNAFPNEKVVGIYAMTSPCLLIRDLDIIKQIMIKDFDMFINRGIELSEKGLGENLFNVEGEKWKLLRSRLSPIFTSGKLKNMFYLMQERGEQFLSHVQEKCQTNTEQEIHSLVQKFTIANISACVFGLDVDTFNDSIDILTEVDRLVLTPSRVTELELLFPGFLKSLNVDFLPAKVNNFFYFLVNNVMTARKGKPSGRDDFMDLILELRQQGTIHGKKLDDVSLEITDRIIAAQAFVFYVGGYESSATTMTYMMYELAMNPEVQDKLIAEVDKSLEENDGQITYNSLLEMKYLEKVAAETLRKYAIVEPIQRRAKEDYRIPGTDVVVQKGHPVLVSIRGIHYDEKLYPNPEKFDPERFSPEEVGKRHPCAYIPFGVGPRNCIGMRFGQFQSRFGMAKFLSKFRVEVSGKTKINLEVEPNRTVVGPKGGV